MSRRVSSSRALWVALSLVGAGSSASAQSVDARRTGVFFRPGLVLTAFNADAMNFTAQRPPRGIPATERGFSGKDLGWGRDVIVGASLGLEVDASVFYVRVGADLMDSPAVTINPEQYRSRFATHAWLDAGPRFRLGPIMVQAGARVGALLMNVTSRVDGQEYSAVTALYGVGVGAQWRPFRWFQLDAAVSQDLSSRLATTVTVGASFGWSGASR